MRLELQSEIYFTGEEMYRTMFPATFGDLVFEEAE